MRRLKRKLRLLREWIRRWEEESMATATRSNGAIGPSDRVPIIQGGYRLGDDDERTPWNTP